MFDGLLGALIPGAVVASALLTMLLRRFALARDILDVPTARSSHVQPTPRGGGVAIVLVFLAALPVLAWRGVLPAPTLLALLGAGLLVAAVGWADDYGHVAAGSRLMIHFGAAFWALAWLGGLPPLQILGVSVDLGWVGDGLAALYLVWLLNLYNFMDGIDGIAGIEAVTVCLGAIVLYALSPGSGDLWALPLLLCAAVSGFLFWNFPRARIFMGDAGSGFVGVSLGVLSLQAASVAPAMLWGWLILLGAFIVDATVTLLRRLFRGERVYLAHRTHAYQQAARRVGAHPPVSLAFGALNIAWLLPVAAMVVAGLLDGALGLLIAYGPLVWLALKYGAGKGEETQGATVRVG